MKPLRVVHLLHSLVAGGKERVAIELATHARTRGDDHRVVLFDVPGLRPSGDLDGSGIPILGVTRHRGLDLGYPARLRRALAGLQPDVVHAHNDSALVYAARALAKLNPRPRLIVTHHNLPSHATLGARWCARAAARRAAAVVCVSAELERNLRTMGWIQAGQVIRNGVDVRRFATRASCGRLRQRLGVSPASLLIGCVARLSPTKRHFDLIEAVRIARLGGRSIHLVCVGDGPERTALANHAHHHDWLTLVPFERDVAGLLVELDAFALVSDHEGLPMSLLEAMACALPVIATSVGGIPELVVDGERSGGLLVPPRDPTAIAGAIERLHDANLRSELGARARAHVCRQHDLDRVAARYRELYAGQPG